MQVGLTNFSVMSAVQLERLVCLNKTIQAIAEEFIVAVDTDLESSISEKKNDEMLLALQQPKKL
jgi:hypothetical protein